MRRLQLAKVREPRDHVPIVMVMQMEYGVPLRHPRVRVDIGAMMSALTTGHGRAQYLAALEEEVRLKDQDIKAAALLPYMDEMLALLSSAVRSAAAQVFLPQPRGRRELSLERRRLLGERRELRGALDVDDDARATTQLELVMVARRMRKLRRLEESEREAWQHLRARRFHDMTFIKCEFGWLATDGPPGSAPMAPPDHRCPASGLGTSSSRWTAVRAAWRRRRSILRRSRASTSSGSSALTMSCSRLRRSRIR